MKRSVPLSATREGPIVVVTAKSVLLDATTTVVALAALFVGFGSLTAATLNVAVIAVASAVPLLTFTVSGKLALDPEESADPFVHEIDPVPFTAGVMHVHPAGTETDWNVVFDGIDSVTVMFVADAPPPFVTVCEKVTFDPATAVAETDTAAFTSTTPLVVTAVVVVALLFAGYQSGVLLETFVAFVIRYPAGAVDETFTVNENVAVDPLESDVVVQVIVPVPLFAGVMQVQPAGGIREEELKVVY